MATTQPKAGLVESTITTGTGNYALLGPVSPWRGFIAADDAKIWPYGVYQDGGGFEEGEGTYNHSARTLARTTILANHLGTTAPVDWGAGSKEVSVVLASSRVVMTTVETKYLADQFLRSFKLFLDSNDDSWISAASNDIIRMFLASAEVFKLEQGKLTISWADDTATEGPELKLARTSATAAINDALSVLRMTGSDSSQNEVTAFKLRPQMTAVTTGAHASRVSFDIAKAGALQPVLSLQPDTIAMPFGINLFTAGKTASSVNTVGAEVRGTGEIVGVCQDAASAYFYRKGSGGPVIDIGQDGASQGGCSISGITVTWGGFTGHHYVDWEIGFDGTAFEAPGTVVQTADGMLSTVTGSDPIKYVLPASNGSRRVYGVIGSRETKIVDNEERSLLLMFAVGNGWIRTIGTVVEGNLLWASSNLGLASAQPNQDVVGPWTIAKALGPSLGTGEDFVPCTYMAGG